MRNIHKETPIIDADAEQQKNNEITPQQCAPIIVAKENKEVF